MLHAVAAVAPRSVYGGRESQYRKYDNNLNSNTWFFMGSMLRAYAGYLLQHPILLFYV
jgi:hypothetical protein